VEKSQYELCAEVLRRLDRAGILKHIVLVGSWCTVLYREYFSSRTYAPALRTRDIDLLVPKPWILDSQVDVAELLKDLGFVVGFTGSQGYIRLEHPQLIVEFLVPEKGKASDKPYPLPKLGLNAQALRFLDFLAQNTIAIHLQGTAVTLPHPANFGLHKLLVLSRRATPEKQAKDKEAALRVLHALIEKAQGNLIRTTFDTIPHRWQERVRKQLADPLDRNVLDIVQ
jgi:hypothetical protein